MGNPDVILRPPNDARVVPARYALKMQYNTEKVIRRVSREASTRLNPELGISLSISLTVAGFRIFSSMPRALPILETIPSGRCLHRMMQPAIHPDWHLACDYSRPTIYLATSH
jgi:hypothetical protein